MDADRWRRLSPLLDALLDAPAAERAATLASLREEDPALAEELERLLTLEQDHDDFLDTPLVAPLPGARSGTEVGPYRLERLLGEGGMGQVWLASRADGLYQRRVALKLLRPGLADPGLRLRFTREREILARLEHAHIARLLDAGISADNQPYLALDYVDGEPLTDWCRGRALDVRARLRLFLQVCDAVSHAHANLIVHRDLKPSNILVTPLDEVRLLDFGIAKLLDSAELPDQTRTGTRAFTLHYAAPEQIRGEPVTTLTDVYALGVVLYELLTDARPYELERASDAQWEQAILEADPLRPSLRLLRRADTESAAAAGLRRRARAVAGDLDNIVLKALAKRHDQRYPSVEALALDLQRYLDGRPVLARRQRLAYRVCKYFRRHRWPLSTAALVAAVLVAALGTVAWQARVSLQEAARAQAMQDFIVGLFENTGSLPEGAPLDVRQLLAAGVERGDIELARQPLAHAGLLGVIARLRMGLGDHPQALALLQRQAAVLSGLDEVPASLRLEAATDRGHVLRLLQRPADCVSGMRELRPLARRQERRLPLQAAEFYSQLGRCQRAVGDRELAAALFQRALSLRRDPLASDAGIAESLADLAGLHADAGERADALREFGAALEQLRATVGERHPLAIAILREVCALERSEHGVDAAERACAQALALAVALRGSQHHVTVEAQRQLAALHLEQGRLAEAEAGHRQLLAWLVSRYGASHGEVAETYHGLGLIARERGEPAQALRALRRAAAIWRHQDDRARLATALTDQALVLLEEDRAAQARPLLDEALRLARPEGSAPQRARTLVALGRVEAALGRRARAHEHLRRAVAVGGDDGAIRRSALALAAFEAALDAPGALARLDRLGSLAAGDRGARELAWLARAHAAALRCREEPAAQASELAELELRVRQAMPEGGTVVREIQALAGTCRGRQAQAPATGP
ncbi:protein kinase [Luteimonas sp. RD2P54]|uniref:Protein kinase n=1 Tax=Luteimonas endophytica TaxID=3042023 RepID=A0ABT6J5A5_9GAMM|nr:serine/threonine-protein kinase [Luteimonas endophytica]MDH5822012.1 protein kinase [Luteimonas endophytica]